MLKGKSAFLRRNSSESITKVNIAQFLLSNSALFRLIPKTVICIRSKGSELNSENKPITLHITQLKQEVFKWKAQLFSPNTFSRNTYCLITHKLLGKSWWFVRCFGVRKLATHISLYYYSDLEWEADNWSQLHNAYASCSSVQYLSV